MTTIGDETTPKPALTWWGMRVGFAAVCKLLQSTDNPLSHVVLLNQVYDELVSGIPVNGPSVWRGKGANRKHKTELEAIILDAKLSTNHIKDEAADQGTLLHDAITKVGVDDELPDILDFAVAQRPYVQGFSRWWLDQEPKFHRQEIIVASHRHAFAGRFDLELETDTPKPKCCPLELWDFKTSKGVYESHFEQLDLYEEGALAIGDIDKPYSRKGIIHLRADGNYRLYESPNPDRRAALASVELYHARQINKRAMPPDYLKDTRV